jgi:hypothetical protein
MPEPPGSSRRDDVLRTDPEGVQRAIPRFTRRTDALDFMDGCAGEPPAGERLALAQHHPDYFVVPSRFVVAFAAERRTARQR